MRLLLSICILAGMLAATALQAAPLRVVSINLCSDITAAALAAPGTLKSVFRLGRDPEDSPVAALLADVPPNDGRIEDILPFAPDLVLAHEWSSPFTLGLLARMNIPVATVKDARSFGDIRDNIRTIAAALGRKEKGEEVIARFDEEMAAARRESANAPTAILYQDLGSAATPNSILGRILSLTGFRNVVTEENAVGLAYPDIEDVIAYRPELIALGIYRPEAPSQANAVLEHPALRLYRERYAEEVRLEAGGWTCSTRFVAGAVSRLAAPHDAMMAQRENTGVIPAKAGTQSTFRFSPAVADETGREP